MIVRVRVRESVSIGTMERLSLYSAPSSDEPACAMEAGPIGISVRWTYKGASGDSFIPWINVRDVVGHVEQPRPRK
jgi:hypothetical protein